MASDGGGETSHIPPTKRKDFLMERNVNHLFKNKKKNKCLKWKIDRKLRKGGEKSAAVEAVSTKVELLR